MVVVKKYKETWITKKSKKKLGQGHPHPVKKASTSEPRIIFNFFL